MTVDDHWAILQAADISEDDVLAVARDRLLSKLDEWKETAERLDAAARDCLALAPPKTSVPERHRSGYGATVSQRDIDGALRVLGAARRTALDAIADPPVDDILAGVLWGLAHREARGDHATVQMLIGSTRRRQADRAGTPGTCRVCGCIDLVACQGGCSWVDAEHTLCSSCTATTTNPDEGR